MPKRAKLRGILMVLMLLTAACTQSDEESAEESEGEAVTGEGAEVTGDEPVEVAPGTVLNLPECPPDWDNTAGLSEDEIRFGISLPESGPVAALGEIDDGMRAYFEQAEPIDGRRVTIVSRDDGYDPARTQSNVNDMLASEELFGFSYLVGTPNNLGVRDTLNEDCIPQLFNSTGAPQWGDPADFPWTTGGLITYDAEAEIWCDAIAEEFGEGATVAGVFFNNDFGVIYERTMQQCAEDGRINLVESLRLEPAAPGVANEITTMAASDADVAVLGVTGAPCPQAMAAIAQSPWDPTVYLSNTCQTVATYFRPIDPAGDGVLVAKQAQDITDPNLRDDPEIQRLRQILTEAGLSAETGSGVTGLSFALQLEQLLLQAAEYEGGLTRVNVMRAAWNADWTIPVAFDGSQFRTNGVEDAYGVEAAQIARYVVDPATGMGNYEDVGELISLEGERGAYEGE